MNKESDSNLIDNVQIAIILLMIVLSRSKKVASCLMLFCAILMLFFVPTNASGKGIMDETQRKFYLSGVRYYDWCKTTEPITTTGGNCAELGELRQSMWHSASEDDQERFNAVVHEESWGLAGYEGYMNQVIAKYESDGTLSDWLKPGGQCSTFRENQSNCTNKKEISGEDQTLIDQVLAGSNVLSFAVASATGGSSVGAGKITCVWRDGRCREDVDLTKEDGRGKCSVYSPATDGSDGECWGREDADAWVAEMEMKCAESTTTGGATAIGDIDWTNISDVANSAEASDRANQVVEYLMSTNFTGNGGKPFNNIQAAVAIAAIATESAHTFDPAIDNGIGYRGIVQWGNGRYTNIAEPRDSLENQLAHIKTELDGVYQGLIGDGFWNASTESNLEEALFLWIRNYEVAISNGGGPTTWGDGKNSTDTYLQYFPVERVKAVYNAIKNLSGSGNTCDNDVGATLSGNYAFPLKLTKSDVEEGVDGSRWCFASTTNCHHDYNAADLMAPEGTVVVAFTGGTVYWAQQDTSGLAGGPRATINIEGDDGNWYYYTHLQANSLTVSDGQQIRTGDTLAKIGSSAAADNTPPHVHLDASDGPRTSCNDSSCGVNYIDIQPTLVKLYELLP